MRVALKRLAKVFGATGGAAALEFALAAPLVFTITIGTIEMGLVMFTWTLMEGSVREASRFGITGTMPESGRSRLEEIRNIVEDLSVGMIDMEKAEIDVRAYPTFEDVGKPEPIAENGTPNGTLEPGESYSDCNGNGQWDSDRGRDADAGGSGDVVVYRIAYDYPLITPVLTDIIGTDGKLPLTATVIARNEPWDANSIAQDHQPCD
jgi:hypothetical protein